MIRPEFLLEESIPEEFVIGAKPTFTIWTKESIPNKRKFKWVPGADPADKRTCSAAVGKDFSSSPVVHEHALHPSICTVPEADMHIVNSVFPRVGRNTGSQSRVCNCR